MAAQLELGGSPKRRARPGRLRRETDLEAGAARRRGDQLSPGLLALLRGLADQLDAASEHVAARRAAGTEPPTGLIMATRGLASEYRETHARLFVIGELASRDPLSVLSDELGRPTVDG